MAPRKKPVVIENVEVVESDPSHIVVKPVHAPIYERLAVEELPDGTRVLRSRRGVSVESPGHTPYREPR